MSNINQIYVNSTTYDIEAKYFVSSSDLQTPEQWKSYIDSAIAGKAKIQLVTDSWNTDKTAPATTASADTMGKIYLCASDTTKAVSGSYVEFVTIQGGTEASPTYTWEKIGTTDTDLTDYAKKGTRTSGAASAANSGSNTTGITITSSGNHTASGTATVTYAKAASVTGEGSGIGAATPTSEAGGFTATPTFTGTTATLSATVSGTTIKTINYTPEGSISGTQTVAAHSHAVNLTATDKTVMTGATLNTDGKHTHSIDSHTHSGSATATAVSGWSGGSLGGTKTFKTDAIKSISGTKNYGFSKSQDVLTGATVTGTVLSFSSETASTQDAHTGDAATDGTVTFTAATCTLSENSFALAATATTLTTTEDGGHTHSVNAATTSIHNVTAATLDTAGGVDINGSNFKFAGTSITFSPAINAYGTVSISYQPAGTVSAITVKNHTHNYVPPIAHTHTITLTDTEITGTAAVKVADHTHTISDPGHTHTIAHTHDTTI